jgi:hypothetical protein
LNEGGLSEDSKTRWEELFVLILRCWSSSSGCTPRSSMSILIEIHRLIGNVQSLQFKSDLD